MARTRLYPPSVDPGFPELPETPSGWRQTTFGEVLEVVERPVKLDPDTTYRLVNAKRNRGGITPRNELPGREILTRTQFEAKAGDFLISRRQIIHGACGVVPDDLDGAVVSNEYSTLRPRPALALDFLRHYSHTPYFQRTCFHSSHGVDVEKMIFKIGEWLVRRIDLPPLQEQLKIAAILSSLDDAIHSTRKVIDQLHVVRRALMSELLTRGTTSRRDFKSLDAPWRLGRVEPGLQEIPKDWFLVPLSTLARLESGHTPSRRQPEYWKGDVPWISLHDSRALDAPELHHTAQTIGPLGIANSSARLLPAGTVVFSRTATVGKCTIMGREMSTSQDFANYVCGDRLHNRYLMHVFRHMQPEWERVMAGSTHQTIYMPVFRDLQVLLPPLDEQRDIAARADALDARLQSEECLVPALSGVKSALMCVLLTGELRVKPDEEAA
jgi:type I restriction enzyme S subunit